MKNYTLQENETILFRGSCILMPDGKRDESNEEKSDIILTNLNIVLFVKEKKFLRTKEEIQAYSVGDVKIYDETVQIIRRKSIVDIYLKTAEIFADFCEEKCAKEFCDKALKLISGNSKFVRGVKKTQKAIQETNGALDIDIAAIAKTGAAFACEVALTSGAGEATKGGSKISQVIAKAIMGRKNGQKETQALIESEDDSN